LKTPLWNPVPCTITKVVYVLVPGGDPVSSKANVSMLEATDQGGNVCAVLLVFVGCEYTIFIVHGDGPPSES